MIDSSEPDISYVGIFVPAKILDLPNITPIEALIIGLLKQVNYLTCEEMIYFLNVRTYSTIARACKKLVQKKLLIETKEPGDRRFTYATIEDESTNDSL